MCAIYVQGVYKILTPHILQCALSKICCSSTYNQNSTHVCKKGMLELVLVVCVYNPYFAYTIKLLLNTYINSMLFYLSLVSTLLYIWYILLQ